MTPDIKAAIDVYASALMEYWRTPARPCDLSQKIDEARAALEAAIDKREAELEARLREAESRMDVASERIQTGIQDLERLRELREDGDVRY